MHNHRCTIWFRVKSFVCGYIKAAVVLTLFYKSAYIVLPVAIIAGVINIRKEQLLNNERWRWQINIEFKEVMIGISASLNAGYSIENAFEESENDLKVLYGDDSLMVIELEKMISELKLSRSLEDVLMEFAQYCQVEDVYNFAEVFQTAKRTGGNLIQVAHSTSERIGEKIEVRREIKTLIAGKQMESRIMNIIPLVLILYFWICSPGFLDCLYTVGGHVFMTVTLSVYMLAYKWSERISNIGM